MDIKNLLITLGFSPKENTAGIFSKKYQQADNYYLEVDLEKETINYGNLIISDSKTTQNFSQPENFVVLECVNRLLETGYNPQNIVLEKTWKLGHQEKGRLDILVTKDDGTSYLMIECKTFGTEYEKELKNLHKSGGQLFSYFQQDKNADILMLYTSDVENNPQKCENAIIKIEDDYRQAGNVKDLFEIWDKCTKNSGIWENPPYEYKIAFFTKKQLKELTETEGNKLFNGFASILRKHSVSDKPNAFNVIFNLFLAKLYDEQKRDTDELEFHWREDDDPVDFQVRLYNLHAKGLNEFLKKEIEGIKDEDFSVKTSEELKKAKKKFLKFNKLFDIKSVLDDNDFEQNHRVLKDVVQLLEKYRIRYPRKQRHLSEFFELLLTTGLKQEAGQYFTPSPIAKFIVRSLPLHFMIEQTVNNEIAKLPAVIDYAVGSGHFVTEILEEYQDIINGLDTQNYYPKAISEVNAWKINPYSWAVKYIYGIEKDYRLVKVAKVGCYFYGDGLAQIVHDDGLNSLINPPKSYVGLLEQNTNAEDSTKNKFSIIVSNPPYSVNDCKDDLEYIGSEKEFTLYNYLTDKSREIECLFVERTKHLLKDEGVAGIVLPSSILSNTGIYTKTREIILQYFDIVAIAAFGGNTFMATNTSTVVLFLRRRNNAEVERIREAAYRLAEQYPKTGEDFTVNGIEKPIQKYLVHTKESTIDTEKLYYFILTYPQKKIVVVKSGEKDAEKRFLGYEFSNRRGSEGIHPIQRGKTIDECTQLFDDKRFDNPEKASTYIYKAFSLKENEKYPEIPETLKDHISRVDLVDMLTFDRENFDKNISLAIKKKVKIESSYPLVSIAEITNLIESGSRPQGGVSTITKGIYSLGGEHIDHTSGYLNLSSPKFVSESFYENANRGKLQKNDLLICKDGALTGKVALVRNELDDVKAMINEHIFILRCPNLETQKYLFYYFFSQDGQELLKSNITGAAQGGLNSTNLQNIKIPLPPLEIQQKIVSETEILEKKAKEAREEIEKLIAQLDGILENKSTQEYKLDTIISLEYGVALPEQYRIKGKYPVVGSNGIVGYHNEFLVEAPAIIVGRKGSAGKINWIDENCTPIDTTFFVRLIDNVEYSLKMVYYAMKRLHLEDMSGGTGVPGLNRNDAYSKIIYLPPLFEQQKIISDIEKIEGLITEAQKIINDISPLKTEILKKYL
ncbi:hypothetical protein FACS1894145_1950 [Bacteroidia bacterium]|nr:hypothetical protein FACS1894145_1950 [Bacteroidia bacterium]